METLTSSPPVLPATSSAFVEEAKGGPSPHQPRAMPVREDCWNEDETFTLIEAWGQHYLDLNRGNLRQKHWQEVADAVNHRHANPNPHPIGKKAPRLRTDVQCKNRIDTLKKKYKVEKSRVLDSHGSYSSPWPFFTPLDSLLAGSLSSSALALKKASPVPSSTTPPPVVAAASHAQLSSGSGGPPMAVPLLPYRRLIGMSQAMPTATPVLPHKRPSPATNSTPLAVDYSSFRKNYSAVAAAAAAADSDDEDEDAEEEKMDADEGLGPDDVKGIMVMGEAEGIRKLARAIERFGEVYAKVETEKQRQIVELEKQRMQFAKELECQRMQMLVELQVQLQKVKRAKRSTSNDVYR